MAFLQQHEIDIKKTSQSVTVPINPFAKLKYYLLCVASSLDVREELAEYTDYTRCNFLSLVEKKAIVALCYVFSPDELIGKCWFVNQEMDCNNEFFELSHAQKTLLVAENVVIGAQNRRVANIMFVKKIWIENNFLNPMKAALHEIEMIGT